MEEALPEVFGELSRVVRQLERHYRDMQDIEFTVEEGGSTCCRRATASAPPRRRCSIAVDMAKRGADQPGQRR